LTNLKTYDIVGHREEEDGFDRYKREREKNKFNGFVLLRQFLVGTSRLFYMT
jgi:hypothetical protein